jgi:hypothetical protein
MIIRLTGSGAQSRKNGTTFAIPECKSYYLFLATENQMEVGTVFTGGKF